MPAFKPSSWYQSNKVGVIDYAKHNNKALARDQFMKNTTHLLIEKLASGDGRASAAACALAKIAESDSLKLKGYVSYIVPFLGSPNLNVRAALIWTLCYIDTDESLDAILSSFFSQTIKELKTETDFPANYSKLFGQYFTALYCAPIASESRTITRHKAIIEFYGSVAIRFKEYGCRIAAAAMESLVNYTTGVQSDFDGQVTFSRQRFSKLAISLLSIPMRSCQRRRYFYWARLATILKQFRYSNEKLSASKRQFNESTSRGAPWQKY
ncbi:MAG: hypothetical protein C0485_13810 [Pirellula sp.]|nr:hypothetical protein [Pirellula sp.]